MNNERPRHPQSLKHELRTPLNQIIGYTEMLLEEAQDQKQDVFIPDLQRIHAAGRRLLAVVDDLFDPTQSTEKKLDDSYLHHELRTPLNQIIGYTEMLQEEASERSQQPFISDFQRIHAAARQLLGLLVE